MRFSPSRFRLAAAASMASIALYAGGATTTFACARVANTIIVTGKPATGQEGVSSADLSPPLKDYPAFAEFMQKTRGDRRAFLQVKWARYQDMIRNKDLWRDKEKRAFLMTPREEFARTASARRAYAHSFLGIGCGVTISGPHIVGRMTSELDIKPGDKVLEIGTGSGYQSAMLSYLTPNVYTIEIIPQLAAVTNKIYAQLTAAKYSEFGHIRRKRSDGYFGWPEQAPYDKIIVTAGIDHIPPPLLKQLAVGGAMIIPVGPPGAQSLLKLTKTKSPSGRVRIKRHDIYAARCSTADGQRCKRKVSFVAFTKYRGNRTVSRWGGK